MDEYSKKLKLEAHLKLLVYPIVANCITLTAFCDSLQSEETEKKGLITISKTRLSVVNESKDYSVFVWTFYELLYLIAHRHNAPSRVCKEFCLMGIDATSIKPDLPFAAYGYHSLTGTIEKGIKIHLAALLGRFTIPLTAMVTPMNVSDSDEFDDVLTDARVDLQRVILVFDRGCWSLERFRDLTANGIRFIIPLKSGVKYTAITRKKGLDGRTWRQSSYLFLESD